MSPDCVYLNIFLDSTAISSSPCFHFFIQLSSFHYCSFPSFGAAVADVAVAVAVVAVVALFGRRSLSV